LGVLGYQRLAVVRSPFQGRQIGSVSHVPERDTDIAEKTPALDAFDRGPAKEVAELCIVQVEVIA
jgi:hypothetical protein